jgi:antitoxin ParD1/3/4
MTSMNVSLSEAMKDWVEAQAASGRYGSVGDYVRDLIRRDQERSDGLAQLQPLITEGFDSGISTSSLARMRAAQRP